MQSHIVVQWLQASQHFHKVHNMHGKHLPEPRVSCELGEEATDKDGDEMERS